MKVKIQKRPNGIEILAKIKNDYVNNQTFVVLTDKGYLIGDVILGIAFTPNKEEGRKFKYNEAVAYKSSIFDDLTEYYGCNWMEFQRCE